MTHVEKDAFVSQLLRLSKPLLAKAAPTIGRAASRSAAGIGQAVTGIGRTAVNAGSSAAALGRQAATTAAQKAAPVANAGLRTGNNLVRGMAAVPPGKPYHKVIDTAKLVLEPRAPVAMQTKAKFDDALHRVIGPVTRRAKNLVRPALPPSWRESLDKAKPTKGWPIGVIGMGATAAQTAYSLTPDRDVVAAAVPAAYNLAQVKYNGVKNNNQFDNYVADNAMGYAGNYVQNHIGRTLAEPSPPIMLSGKAALLYQLRKQFASGKFEPTPFKPKPAAGGFRAMLRDAETSKARSFLQSPTSNIGRVMHGNIPASLNPQAAGRALYRYLPPLTGPNPTP